MIFTPINSLTFKKTIFKFLARLFYKTEEVLSPPARRRRRIRHSLRRLRRGKLLRQKILSTFISSLTHNLLIFAVLIHMVVPIDNQALINIHLYYFPFFPMFWQCFNLENIWCGKIIKAKDHVQFYIKFNSESFKIYNTASLYHTHQYVGVFKLIYFVIFLIFWCFMTVFT